jgi:hypothetical protein
VERALLGSPLASLNGADAFLRAQVLEERQGFAAARDAYAYADEHSYSGEVRAARDAALARVVELARRAERIVDVATGRGTLLERLVRETDRPLVALDVSRTVLERVRLRLGDDRIEYIEADVRALPFPDASLPLVVSHLGIANVPADALPELRRVARELVTTHIFYPADAAGGLPLLVRKSGLKALDAAGWDVSVEDEREVRAAPTPESALIPGVRIDGVPTKDTIATWCVVRAR